MERHFIHEAECEVVCAMRRRNCDFLVELEINFLSKRIIVKNSHKLSSRRNSRRLKFHRWTMHGDHLPAQATVWWSLDDDRAGNRFRWRSQCEFNQFIAPTGRPADRELETMFWWFSRRRAINLNKPQKKQDDDDNDEAEREGESQAMWFCPCLGSVSSSFFV